MAISRERLEELIKEKKPVYSFIRCGTEIFEFSTERVVELSTERAELIDDCLYIDLLRVGCLDELYENKKDAEFALKYTNIPRIEYLSLPTWEEFCKSNFTNIEFYIKGKRFILEYWFEEFTGIIIHWYSDDCDSGTLFYEPLTEENYYKALDLCVKLWK